MEMAPVARLGARLALRASGALGRRPGMLLATRQRAWPAPVLDRGVWGGSRGFATEATPSKATEKGEEGKEDKKKPKNEGHGVPWGLLFVLGFVGAIGGYFYRGRRNQKALKALQDELEENGALSSDEVEEIRKANSLSVAQFHTMSSRVRALFSDGEAKPSDVFAFCGRLVGGDSSKKLGAAHLFERVAARMEERSERERLEVVLTALSMTVDSSIDARIEMLFKVFARDGAGMTHAELVRAVDALMSTWQVPVRCLSREVNKYPFNEYRPSEPEFLATRAIEELVKARKKSKELGEREEEMASLLKERLARADKEAKARAEASPEELPARLAELPEAPALPEAPVWTLKDFEDVIYSRAVCAWGECHAREEALRAAKKN